MTDKSISNRNIIRGSCADFVCRCCRTKYGWEHQPWCDCAELIEPACRDCAYYDLKRKRCKHPAKKRKRRDAK